MKTTKRLLPSLLAFLSIGAIAGGGLLMVSPSGELLRIPLSALGSSPFTNFLIPGIILFFVVGILPGLLVFALLKKHGNTFAEKLNVFRDMHWAWTFTIYEAFALITWIQAEMIFENGVHWLHSFYMFLALLIIFVALLPRVKNFYKK